ncbi:uncharacterized protein LOC114529492 [Dendronephthya gigantea]|uniref:uncharacterized protein LOC114529492 n=1 Tax=Dendronephthya gigantea TaxID=151771 RepID=UPI00106C4F06|nr:uncharacterized protein LOC114529492 [Dendronephthya gigantea]
MDEMDDRPPGQPTILMRITKILVDHAKNKACEMRDELDWMENNLEQKSDKLIMKKIKELKMEVTKKLEQNCFFSRRQEIFASMMELNQRRNIGWERIDELEKKMSDNLDLEQESDELMMEEIKMLKMEVLVKLVKLVKNLTRELDYEHFFLSNQERNKELDVMDELEKLENMLDLEQKSDKLMMEEIKNLKIEVMKKLVKNLGCHSFLPSPTNQAFHVVDELKKMENMLDLEQESDKLMMKEIRNLKMEVLKKLVKNLVKNLGCHSFVSSQFRIKKFLHRNLRRNNELKVPCIRALNIS